MPNPKLLGIVTALLIVSRVAGANANDTLSQLQAVQGLIESRDCGALMSYLAENPELLEGGDALAISLRQFTQDVDGGLIPCLSVAPGTVSPQQETTSTY